MEQVAPELLTAYASLFVHCSDQYAVQQRDGSYWRVREPLTLPLLAAHLRGQWTLGTYLLDAQSTCRFAVFDADRETGLGQLTALSCELAHAGIFSVLEASRRGGHLWLHFTEPAPASLVRAWLLPYAAALGVELYPKQDWRVPGGSGSLIRLPLGVHQRTRRWYPFVQMDGAGNLVPVGATVAECCAWLCRHVQPVAVPLEVGRAVAAHTSAGKRAIEVVNGGWPARMASHGRYESIRAWCQARDLVEVIGRYVALDQRGRGSCPFKAHHDRGDVRPSFQVFEGPDPHWYCYTWQRAGNLFDFLCLYYGVTPQAMWRRIQQEEW